MWGNASNTKQMSVVRRYYDEALNADLERLDAILADSFVEHEVVPGLPPTREGLKLKYAQLRAGFSDLRFTVEDLIPSGDRITARVQVSGTHDRAFMGQPPTGRRFVVTAMGIFRVTHGHIVEHWGVFDQMSMLAQ
jgi:predicted ester cyclase